VDDGPLSIKVVVNGKTVGGFDMSASSYAIPVAAGGSTTISKIIPADPSVRYEILSQSAGRAVVRVTGKSYFGPIVKDYVFTMVRVNGDWATRTGDPRR
jgi:alpha-glucuronidase